ncbi:MAG: flagellar hook-length control protein FliK [Alphaproteobacteria bacterium]|nr:flagellar hook-length control protein FliK [Alphaproteobacteria bacterium]
MANIVSLNRAGIPPLPQAPAESVREPQDASGFGLPPADLKNLTAEIAALLQKDGNPPETPPAASLEDLMAKIAALLQKTGAPPGDSKIRPALISDLVGKLSLQIQDQAPVADNDLYQAIAGLLQKDGTAPAPELTTLLDKIQSGSGDMGDIAKVLARLQSQAQNQTLAQNIAAAPDPAVLQLLKDAAARLQASGDETGNDALAKFKTELGKTLKDQGLDQPAVEVYLAALAGFVKHIPPAELSGQPDAVAVMEQPLIPPAAAATAPAGEVSSRPMAPPQIPAPSDIAGNAGPAKETPRPDAPQSTAGPSLPQKDEQAPRLKSATAEAPPPAPPQSANARTAAVHLATNMVNMLANSDGGLDFDGFGAGSDGQSRNMTDSAVFLKPADVLTAQSFTNYLAAARNLPGAVTQMIGIQLQRNISAKISTMTLQLEPADLGRLDIKLKFDKEGGVKAHLSVEKPETLALLQRDSHHLEKILQQTGLDFDENALSFDLRQQNQRQNLEGFSGSDKGNADEFSAHINGTEKTLQAKIAVQANGYITQNGVNIMV